MKLKYRWIAIFLFPFLAQAETATLKLGRSTANGSGCKNLDVVASIPLEGRLAIEFKSFKGVAQKGFTRKNCSVAIPIELGLSNKILLKRVEMSGTSAGSPAGELRVESFFSRERTQSSKRDASKLAKKWSESSDLNVESACGASANFRLNASFLLHSSANPSELQMDSISYVYEILPCP